MRRWPLGSAALILLLGLLYATAIPGSILRHLAPLSVGSAALAGVQDPPPSRAGSLPARYRAPQPVLRPFLQLPSPRPPGEGATGASAGDLPGSPDADGPGPSSLRVPVGSGGVEPIRPQPSGEEPEGIPPPLPREAPPAAQPVVRVMTFNIRHALGLDGQVSLERVAAAIGEADVVFLSEVDRYWLRSGLRDQPAVLQELAGFAYAYFAPTLSLPGPSRQYGNLLLSRYPIRRARAVPLPQPEGAEARVMIEAQLDVEGRVWFLFGVHLGLDREERRLQVEAIRSRAEAVGEDRILLGDFNATLEAPEMRPLLEGTEAAWTDGLAGLPATFPAWEPAARIDQILLSPSLAARRSAARVEESDASDHLPAWVELTLSPAGPPVHRPSGLQP